MTASSEVLCTHYRSHVTGADMQSAVSRVESLIARTRSNFTGVADMSEMELMDLDCAPYLARIMEQCRAHGIGKVMRVIPDPKKDIGVNILCIVHYRGKVPIATYETKEGGSESAEMALTSVRVKQRER
jgi:hypothetical protein